MAANRPTAAELTLAVQEFLSTELLGALEREDLQFKLRVAINVLRMVERGLVSTRSNDARELAVLAALTGHDDADLQQQNAALCEAIRSGRFDDDMVGLADRLKPIVMDKLAVDNPRYSTFKHLSDNHGQP